jgi:hypothetical protein
MINDFFIVLGVYKWRQLLVDGSHICTVDLGIGFCPVFSTREEAEKEYPDKEIMQIKTENKG